MDKTLQQSLRDLALQCAADNKLKTPEKRWLKERMEDWYRRQGFRKKAEGDARLYEALFGQPPETASAVLKIRYWRTGYSLPASRDLLLRLGLALELTPSELQYLVQGYYDRSDVVFSPEEGNTERYQCRHSLMEELKREFLEKLHPMYLRSLGIPPAHGERYFRHLYYLESFDYIYAPSRPTAAGLPAFSASHLTSVSYASTLRELMALQGEISRKNMLRHLILLTAPFLSRQRLDGLLEPLGYLPLAEDHHLPGGGQGDRLLLGVLALYEEACGGADPSVCTRWLKEAFQELDRCLQEEGHPELRLMYYRSLSKGGESE